MGNYIDGVRFQQLLEALETIAKAVAKVNPNDHNLSRAAGVIESTKNLVHNNLTGKNKKP
jgi:hypothetical protein